MQWRTKLNEQVNAEAGDLVNHPSFGRLRDLVMEGLFTKPGLMMRLSLPGAAVAAAKEIGDEDVLAAVAVSPIFTNEGVLVLTSTRLVSAISDTYGERPEGVSGQQFAVRSYPLTEIVAIHDRRSVGTNRLGVEYAYEEQAVIKAPFSHHQPFIVAFNEATDGLPRPAPAYRPSDGEDEAHAPSLTDELGRLAKLHEDGLLSADEFAAAKAKLLG